MNRLNAIKIQLHEDEWDNADLLTFLYANNFIEAAIQGNHSGDGIFWSANGMPIELLKKYVECFDWIPNFFGKSGNSKLWHNDKPVTMNNYRIAVYNGEEFSHYDYLNWEGMTNIPPVNELE